MKQYWLALSFMAVNSLLAPLAGAELRIEDGYVRGLPPGQPTTAAFMRLVNTGAEDIVIVAGTTPAAKRVEFHAHVNRDGQMSMRQVPHVTVPAGGEFVLQPGDHHLMLIDLSAPLREGDSVKLRLVSSNNDTVTAELPVRSVLNEHHH